MDLDGFSLDEPLHLQQLKHIAAALQLSKQQTDSVTWVPDTIPAFVRQAVRRGLEAAEPPPPPSNIQDSSAVSFDHNLDQNNFDQDPTTFSAADATPGHLFDNAYDARAAAPFGSAADCGPAGNPAAAAAELETGPVVILGSQQCRVGGSSSSSWSKRTDWIISTCLVPDGMPTAAAAEGAGGLAALEVVCRLLVLQDCQPAAPSPGLEKALAKVGWQEFGMTFKDFSTSSSNNDLTGILTLGVLPDAVVTPLALVVCSTDAITLTTAGAVPDAADAAADDTAAAEENTLDASTAAGPSQPAPSSNINGRRKRNQQGSNGNGPAKPAPLSCRREVAMFTVAFESALLALKAQLPPGYLQGKLEGLLAACLPSVSTSLTNIITRAANQQLRQHACNLLGCEPQDMQQSLLAKLQGAAAAALEAKSAVAARQQQREQQQQGGCARLGRGRAAAAAAAAAAALVAAAGDGIDVDGADEGEQLQGRSGGMGSPAEWEATGDRADVDKARNTAAAAAAAAALAAPATSGGNLPTIADLFEAWDTQQQQQHEAEGGFLFGPLHPFRCQQAAGQRGMDVSGQQHVNSSRRPGGGMDCDSQQWLRQAQLQFEGQEDGLQQQSELLWQQQQHTALAGHSIQTAHGSRLCAELTGSGGDLAYGEPPGGNRRLLQLPHEPPATHLPLPLAPPAAATPAAAAAALSAAVAPIQAAQTPAEPAGGAVWMGVRKRRAAVLEEVPLEGEQASPDWHMVLPVPVPLSIRNAEAAATAAAAAAGSSAAGHVASGGGESERAARAFFMAWQCDDTAEAAFGPAAANI